jgi:hypothetical protein
MPQRFQKGDKVVLRKRPDGKYWNWVDSMDLYKDQQVIIKAVVINPNEVFKGYRINVGPSPLGYEDSWFDPVEEKSLLSDNDFDSIDRFDLLED